MPRRKSIPEPEPTYDVEFIRKARVTEDEVWEYYIKWGGYPEEDNSWEPEENLSGCRRMLKSFWEQVGTDMKPKAKFFSLGFKVTPSVDWIERQRKAYSKTAAKKARQKRSVIEDDDEDEDEDEEDEEDEDEGEEEEEARTKHREMSKISEAEASSDADGILLSMKSDRHQVKNKTSSDVSSSENEVSSTRKRKLTEEPGQNDDKKKRRMAHQRLDAVVIPDLAQTSSQVSGKNIKPSRATSPLESLFGDSDSGTDAPLASKSSTPVFNAPSKSKPVEPPHTNLSGLSDVLGSTSSKIPAHQQRKKHPLIKTMPLPVPQPGGPLGISTKARISGLTTGNLGSRSAILSPASPSVSNPLPTVANNTVASEISKTPQPLASAEFDASMWLQENIISTEPVNNSFALPSNPSTTQNLHFSKRWRWTGQLAVGDNESDDGFAEPVGGILLTDNTPLDRAFSEVGIQALVPSHVDSLCLRHSYPLSMLPAVMADIKISQFARMSANKADEDNLFSHLVAYMTKHELYSQTPLFIADRKAATMFVFPACFEYLWDQLGVPPKARQEQDFLVAIGFQIYEPMQGALGRDIETYSSNWKYYIKPEIMPETNVLDCSRALQALTFPDVLYKRIAHKECALFTTSTDKGRESPDTLDLTTVLNSAPGCKIVPIVAGSARFIFIHVGAWDMLHKLIGLVDRRRRRQDVQFYTYGSDPIVEKKYWGVHEVFPIGGVVTFTPRAIAEDPEGVEKLISKLDEHPLWACYVLPSVVAMIVEVIKSDNGPNSKLKGVVDALCGILMPIEKGQIALTWQPPSSHAWDKENANDSDLTPKCISWMIDQGRLSDLRGHDLVLECQKRLEHSPDRSEKDVESRIVNDMVVMQSELRRLYRRFVIITDSTGVSNTSREAAANTTASKADIKAGFEFTHVDDFTFGDDYIFPDT